MKTRYMLYSGSGIPVVFWMTTIICGFMLGDYNHLSRMVSELGALGTRSGFVFSTGLMACAILSVWFVIGLYRTCRTAGLSIVPAVIILSYSISIAGAAIFPLPLRMHLIMGMPSVLLILSPFTGFFLWSGKRRLPNMKQMALCCFLVMSLGFLAFMPGVWSDSPGLKQRFFHMGWSIWFFYVSYAFVRLAENGKQKK